MPSHSTGRGLIIDETQLNPYLGGFSSLLFKWINVSSVSKEHNTTCSTSPTLDDCLKKAFEGLMNTLLPVIIIGILKIWERQVIKMYYLFCYLPPENVMGRYGWSTERTYLTFKLLDRKDFILKCHLLPLQTEISVLVHLCPLINFVNIEMIPSF